MAKRKRSSNSDAPGTISEDASGGLHINIDQESYDEMIKFQEEYALKAIALIKKMGLF